MNASALAKYFRLYGHFLKFSVSKGLEYRADFWFRIIMDMTYYAMMIAFYEVLFRSTSIIGGWAEPQMIFFLGGAMVIDAMQMTFLANNVWSIPQLINKGDLDYYLVRPVSPLFFVSFRDVSASSAVNLVMAWGILGYGLWNLPGEIPWARLPVFLLLILNGFFLFYCVRLMAALPVFWTHSSTGFEMLFHSATHFIEKPHRIFRGGARFVLTFILPFSLMASVPAAVFLEGLNIRSLVTLFGMSFVLFGVILAIWRAGLRSYSSASS